MRVLRPRRQRRDFLRWFVIVAGLPAVGLLSIIPAEASSVLGLPLGKNGLPATWVGEALTVAMAFALPAILAGLFAAVRRAVQRFGARGVVLLVLVAAIGSGAAVAIELRPDLFAQLVAFAGGRE